jgi:hypothetical protein
MIHLRKIVALLIVIIAIPFCLSHAQESEQYHSLQQGSKALQFQISGNFTLNPFTGTALSYKHQVSQHRARRIGISLESRYYERDYPESMVDMNENNLDVSFGVEYTWMNYTNPESDIKFYYGYGPGIRVQYDKTDNLFDNRTSESLRSSFGLSGIGYTGVEWFFRSNMSLHAEYRASARINYTREKNRVEVDGIETQNTGRRTTMVTLNGDGVLFGLSVYF